MLATRVTDAAPRRCVAAGLETARALKRRLAVRWRRMFSRVRVSAWSVIGEFNHGCASAAAGVRRRVGSVTSSFDMRSFALHGGPASADKSKHWPSGHPQPATIHERLADDPDHEQARGSGLTAQEGIIFTADDINHTAIGVNGLCQATERCWCPVSSRSEITVPNSSVSRCPTPEDLISGMVVAHLAETVFQTGSSNW